MFKEHVAFVTGGAGAIGTAYISALIKNGAKVCFCDINENAGRSFETKMNRYKADHCVFYKCNVKDEDKLRDCLEDTVKRFGRVHFFVQNAAVISEPDAWREQLEVNLTSVIRNSKMAIKYMQPHGYIVITTSQASLFSNPLHPLYIAEKAALNCFVRSYGGYDIREVTGINVIAIAPGATEDHSLRKSNKFIGPEEYYSLQTMERGKFLESQKSQVLAAGLIFLLRTKVVTGSVWVVDQNLLNLVTFKKW